MYFAGMMMMSKFMKELQEKYARVILESCLKMEKDQPLVISYNVERSDFV